MLLTHFSCFMWPAGYIQVSTDTRWNRCTSHAAVEHYRPKFNSNCCECCQTNIHHVASDNVYYWHNDYYCLNAVVCVTYLFQVTDFLRHVCDLCICVPVTVSVIASFISPLLSHMAVHHLHHLYYHRLQLLLLARYIILNSNLALQQILSSIDLFLSYQTDYTDSHTI